HFESGGIQFLQGAHPVILKPGQAIFLNDPCEHELIEEAYRRFRIDPPAVARAFSWVDDDYLLIHDDLTGSLPELSHWHLQVVGGSPRVLGDHDYRFPGRFGVDLRLVLPDQDFDSSTSENLPILHYSGSPDSWFSMEHLQLTRRNARHYLAALRPVDSAQEDAFEFRSLRKGEDIVGAEVTGSGRNDLHWFARPGLEWQGEEILFSGSYGALLRKENQTRLLLLGSGTLHYGSTRIHSDGPQLILTLTKSGTTLEAFGHGDIAVETPGIHRQLKVEDHFTLQHDEKEPTNI
ncbi:MAG: hypothetical protein ACQKBT_03130, partial [Puniceicoccales bacterium]